MNSIPYLHLLQSLVMNIFRECFPPGCSLSMHSMFNLGRIQGHSCAQHHRTAGSVQIMLQGYQILESEFKVFSRGVGVGKRGRSAGLREI